jgi:tetraprenyl-beta-curcumene synthase
MQAATQVEGGLARYHSHEGAVPYARASTQVADARYFGLSRMFIHTVTHGLFWVLPQANAELAQWRAKALEIPNQTLREAARESLGKRGNIEGAALFATLTAAADRGKAVHALVAFQAAYNYLDTLSELPSPDPIANGDQLHQALVSAVSPGSPHGDYYAHNPDQNDGGFLVSILDECRDALADLPSFPALAATLRAAAERIASFQSMNLSEVQGDDEALRRWATEVTPTGCGLQWWEVAASAGSSLAVHALIASAADQGLDARAASAIETAYFPWIGGLHSLLDSLVDRREDGTRGQRNLLDYYQSPTQAAISLASLAKRSRAAMANLPRSHTHRVIATAMCSYYLTAPECDRGEARTVARVLTRVLGTQLSAAIAMFRVRRAFRRLTNRSYT